MAEPGLILVDWGTSRRRAWLVTRDGETLDRREDEAGMLSLPPDGFAPSFDGLAAGWPACPVLLAGMVGARQGWVEAPYLDCPTTLSGLAERLTPVPGRDHAWIVPGLRYRDGAGGIDVLRGEEVQVCGTLASAQAFDLLILPGTHCKWVEIDVGRVISFRTYMTGEFYDLLMKHGSIGRAADGQRDDAAAYETGLRLGGATGDTLGRLFAVRAACVGGDLVPASVAAMLSGLLIGREVADALDGSHPTGRVAIIGRGDLARQYRLALENRGIDAAVIDGEIARDGLLAIARERGMLR
ncbi:MAG: 2-dehydro-3-deoxygalactonokinase [Azospirillaceae bacterium]